VLCVNPAVNGTCAPRVPQGPALQPSPRPAPYRGRDSCARNQLWCLAFARRARRSADAFLARAWAGDAAVTAGDHTSAEMP